MRKFIYRAIISLPIISTLSFLIYVYPLNVLAHLLFDAKVIEPVSIIPTAIIAFAVITYFRTHLASPLLSLSIYYGMGIGFIGFFIVNIGLLLSLALPQFAFEIGLVSFSVWIGFCIKSILNGLNIHLKDIKVTSPKIHQNYKLIFISDIHIGSNSNKHLEKICEKISKLDYDYLLIGGDLFDSSAFKVDDLSPLKALKKPILFVTGNHEYYVKGHKEKVAGLTNYNIEILDNRSLQLKELNIIGISDNQAPNLQAEVAHDLVKQDAFNLLMVHQPSIWDSIPENTDLMLSGHTHNGQIFPFNFLVRSRFKTVYGIYKRLNTILYVSSGSGTWGPRMRLGTQNEIVQVLILPQN